MAFKRQFENSRFKSWADDPEVCITGLMLLMSDDDFMPQMMDNLSQRIWISAYRALKQIDDREQQKNHNWTNASKAKCSLQKIVK